VSNFCDKIFRGFRSTGGQSPRFPIDFAGHRYNSAALPRSLWWNFFTQMALLFYFLHNKQHVVAVLKICNFQKHNLYLHPPVFSFGFHCPLSAYLSPTWCTPVSIVQWINPLHFLADCCNRRLNQGSSVLLCFALYYVCVFFCGVLFVSIS